MPVDSSNEPLQIRCEFPEHLPSLVIGELLGIGPNPLQQRHRLRAGSLCTAVPRRTTLLRLGCHHHEYSCSNASRPRPIAIFSTALRVTRIMGSLLIFAQSLSALVKNSPGNRSAVWASLAIGFFRIATPPPF
jgi:hypothetical protein